MSRPSVRTFSYAAILHEFGLEPTLRYPWAVVGQTTLIQGWKLHLSSIQTEAARLIRVAVPILVDQKISFKVAQDDFVLGLLNEGEFGATQVGKFITIYPESGECAREVAERLISLTDGFTGPEIVTDQHLGSIVYARYGGFNPVSRRDRLGNPIAMIEAADGSPIADRYAVPFAPPAGVPNPFSNLNCEIAEASANGAAESSRKLVGPGYLIVEAIKPRPYGGTFLAIDLRAQETVALKILKHGRHHCMSDAEGREIRDRLRRQGVLHRQLSGRVAVPGADEYFEVDGNGYLPIEHLEGNNFEDFVNSRVAQRKWNQLGAVVQEELMGCLARIVEAVGQFHAAGYVHRDLSPGNILIGSDGRVHLLDLELAHRIGDTAPAYGLGTAGFMSRQQAARKSPTVADDVFALGCLMTFVLTGLDPRRTVFSSDRYRRRRMARLARGAPHQLIDLIDACLANDPKRRPDLATVKEIVARYESPASGEPASEQTAPPPFAIGRREKSRVLDQVLENGQLGLLKEFNERPGGLWLSARSPRESGRAAGIYQVERYANRGVAGVVYLLARLARCGHEQSPIRDCVQRSVAWLLNSEPDSEDRLPGLHFGEAGVAVAIAEAVAAGYVARDERIDAFLKRSLDGKLDWPDLTHGAAGQGLAALCCAERLGDAWTKKAHRCADYLIETQAPDGSWQMPDGVEGLSGQSLTGFAHGAAGIAYFLAEYANRFERRDAARALGRAIEWLIAHAESAPDGEGLQWPLSTSDRHRWRWWCHGAPGIALTFLKLYEHTREERHAELARRALSADRADIRYANLSQCHGLSGLGEIYLEAARVLGDRYWHEQAQSIADDLLSLARQDRDESLTWLVEDPYLATGDLMVGYSGVLHFLLRLSSEGRSANNDRVSAGLPLSLDVDFDVNADAG